MVRDPDIKMQALIEENRKVKEEIKKIKDELEIQTWGLRKTNEGIKTLYRELEKKNEELKKLDQLKSDFISTVSHELRTPLAIIKEGISLILDRIPGEINEKQEKVLITARDNIDRLSRIINNLLDISKIEAGKVELKKELINIVELVKHVISSFEPKVNSKGLELRLDVSSENINVYVDGDKIIQVFTNLIGNALKFTEKGYIEILIKEKEGEIECAVTDTGRGISEDDLPKLFSKFQQFGRSAGGGEKGTGLGLSIVKGIIELHNGKIWAEGRLGKGMKFTFTLPRYSIEMLFKEYINKGIKEAVKNGSKMTLVVISIGSFEKLKQKLSCEKIHSILHNMEGVLNSSLRRSGDVVVKDTGEIIVILSDCGPEGAINVIKRLEEALKGYLSSEELAGLIELRFGYASYPDEAGSDEELIKKARNSRESGNG